MGGEVSSLLDRLDRYRIRLEEYTAVTDADTVARRDIERYIQLSIEVVVEIARTLLASTGVTASEMPDDPDPFLSVSVARQHLLALSDADVVPGALVRQMVSFATFRDRLRFTYRDDITPILEELDEQVVHLDAFGRHIRERRDARANDSRCETGD